MICWAQKIWIQIKMWNNQKSNQTGRCHDKLIVIGSHLKCVPNGHSVNVNWEVAMEKHEKAPRTWILLLVGPADTNRMKNIVITKKGVTLSPGIWGGTCGRRRGCTRASWAGQPLQSRSGSSWLGSAACPWSISIPIKAEVLFIILAPRFPIPIQYTYKYI